jgi:hypothetical protein
MHNDHNDILEALLNENPRKYIEKVLKGGTDRGPISKKNFSRNWLSFGTRGFRAREIDWRKSRVLQWVYSI